ncbi:hypothetical protein [Tessaracoccus caeni]|uniref:hypothetical protein n=1 Tax=Tessaracoccus caeni TaxID=3031239 RepID=UPI0023DCCF06|nr:hypothetical protein [Tessaracoccus caeni]MDF1489661.1 hypothetical protein [Tessaracoccus caeni]
MEQRAVKSPGQCCLVEDRPDELVRFSVDLGRQTLDQLALWLVSSRMGSQQRYATSRRRLVLIVAALVALSGAAVAVWASTWGPQWYAVVPDSYHVGPDESELVLFLSADKEPAPVEATVVSQEPDSVVVEVHTRDNPEFGTALGYERTVAIELAAPLEGRRVFDVSGREVPKK